MGALEILLNRLKDAIKSNDVDMQQYILCCFTHLSISDSISLKLEALGVFQILLPLIISSKSRCVKYGVVETIKNMTWLEENQEAASLFFLPSLLDLLHKYWNDESPETEQLGYEKCLIDTLSNIACGYPSHFSPWLKENKKQCEVQRVVSNTSQDIEGQSPIFLIDQMILRLFALKGRAYVQISLADLLCNLARDEPLRLIILNILQDDKLIPKKGVYTELTFASPAPPQISHQNIRKSKFGEKHRHPTLEINTAMNELVELQDMSSDKCLKKALLSLYSNVSCPADKQKSTATKMGLSHLVQLELSY